MKRMKIKITINDNLSLHGVLNKTATAQKFTPPCQSAGKAAPGAEKFISPHRVASPSEENARDILEAGEIAYWPPMQAICFLWSYLPAGVLKYVQPDR